MSGAAARVWIKRNLRWTVFWAAVAAPDGQDQLFWPGLQHPTLPGSR